MRTLSFLPEERRSGSRRRRSTSTPRSPTAWAWRRCGTSWRNWPSATWSPKPTTSSRHGRAPAQGERGLRRGAAADHPEEARGRPGARGGSRGRIQAPLQHPPEAAAPAHHLDQVYDLLAVRIVTRTVKDCYAALGIIHQTWRRCPGASRTSSPCRGRTSTSRCTPRSSARAACRSRSRSAPRRCTAGPRRASPPTGSTRRGASAPRATSRLRLAAAAGRVAAGGPRPAGVHPEPQDRPLPGGGLHLHAQGEGEVAAARRDADRLRLRHSHRSRRAVRRRQGERAHGAACARRSRTATSSRS